MQIQEPVLVTIVTPSFNQGAFIERTIQSVLAQTYPHIQYILIDGGSTDKTMEVVNKYKDVFDIIIHEKDKGQTDAINKGFRLAKGQLVGWLNSDDVLYPDCVEKIVSMYLANPEAAIYYGSSLDFIDEQDRVFEQCRLPIPDHDFLLNKNYSIIQQGSFYAVEQVAQCGYLNEQLYYCMDLDLWLKLSLQGPVLSYSEKPLAAFRFWSDTKTVTGAVKAKKEMRATLLKYGARFWSPNIRRTYWYQFKGSIKNLLIKSLTGLKKF